MKKKLLILLTALTFTGCVGPFDRDRGGNISAPANILPHVNDLMNAAIQGFSDEHNLHLKWKWDQWDIRIKTKPVVKYFSGQPAIERNGPNDLVGAYFDYRTNIIYVPERDLRRDNLVHELGHLLLWLNGYRDIAEHHVMFHRFFMERFRYGGGSIL